jgi:ATP-dependent Clp protease ATP-binding subunit ClpC
VFDRFTDRARKVMGLARQEAQRLNHEYIGTEHILLGLVQEESGVAANVLKNMDVDLKKIRIEVEKLVQSGGATVTMGQLPFTPRAKKVLEYALEEASQLGHNYIGTEHLLLGLLRESDGVAAQVLLNLGLKLEEVREEVLELLGAELPSSDAAPRSPRRPRSMRSGATSRSWRAKTSSTPSSAATTKSSGSSRSSAAAPRTTRCCWARPASARRRSSRGWRSRSSRTRCRTFCAIAASSCSTSP